jgi:polyphosphate:AMP phosphotransferase
VFEAAEIEQKVSKQEFERRAPGVRTALLAAQDRLEGSPFALVVVVAGVEGSGKGETVNLLLEWMDARGVQAHALGLADPDEAERPPMYRFWRRLPPRGQIGIFFGSWYTQPILDHSFGRISDADLDRALDRIVDFERMLHDEGVALLKLWLHISKQRQRKVFRKLERSPKTAWRVTRQDWKFHETYGDFVATSARALRRTDTAHAPWQVVAARDKRYRELEVGRLLLAALGDRLDAPVAAPAPPAALPVPAPVNVLSSLDLRARLEPQKYEQRLDRAQGRLGALSRRMTEAQREAVVVFEGFDAAGKGGCIRRVTHALDARYYVVAPIAAPTDEEKAHPYLWRFWRRLPGRGQFTLYDRSWYGRVMVERIEGLCAPEAWRRAYSEINAFEEQLVEAGISVFKFWLEISPEEQLRRFEERDATEYKRYKLTPEDWRNREKWLAYQAAACEMIERTSTEIAPWHLVAGEDKLHARVTVVETLADGVERLLGGRDAVRASGKRRRRA